MILAVQEASFARGHRKTTYVGSPDHVSFLSFCGQQATVSLIKRPLPPHHHHHLSLRSHLDNVPKESTPKSAVCFTCFPIHSPVNVSTLYHDNLGYLNLARSLILISQKQCCYSVFLLVLKSCLSHGDTPPMWER